MCLALIIDIAGHNILLRLQDHLCDKGMRKMVSHLLEIRSGMKTRIDTKD